MIMNARIGEGLRQSGRQRLMGRGFSRWNRGWGYEPALWHRLRGAGGSAALPEVSAIAATSGYCLPTLRVEEMRQSGGQRERESAQRRFKGRLLTSSPTMNGRIRERTWRSAKRQSSRQSDGQSRGGFTLIE